MNRSLFSEEPSPISGHLATPETEVGPPPLAENIRLPNEPSPISGHLATSETEVEPPPRAKNIELPNDPSAATIGCSGRSGPP
jgi:hypothetical protein